MAKRLVRIAPWQAGKVFALIYFALSFVLVIPMALLRSAMPASQHPPSVAFLLFFPFLYALAAMIFIPLGCWLYNVAAKFTGGIEVGVAEVGGDA